MNYIKSKSFKIVSRFYVIYGDYDPIYVGYTNRTVKQRFKEHQKDKDFSDYEKVEVKELVDEKLSFDFTWDYEQTCKNADKVSLREGQLVQQYGTQDSVFQKADGGGQTWATEKWFVECNKDNPRFADMSGAEIKRHLKEEKVISVWLHNFVNHIQTVEEVWIHNFVSSMLPIEEVWLSRFVSHMLPIEEVWTHNFVSNMQPIEEIWIDSFINRMQPVEEVWLSNFVNHIQTVEEVWIHNFVSSMLPIEEFWLSNFVKNMKPVEEVWLSDFVHDMKPVEEVWLSNFIGNMQPKKDNKK